MINVNKKLNGINRIPYNDKLPRDKIFMDQPLTNFHGIRFRRLRSPISHTHFWLLHVQFFLIVATTPCSAACFQIQVFFLLRGKFHLFSFIRWSSSTTPLKPETPGPSHLSNSLRTRLITHQVCVLMLSVSFFYHYLVFCTALSPLDCDTVTM